MFDGCVLPVSVQGSGCAVGVQQDVWVYAVAVVCWRGGVASGMLRTDGRCCRIVSDAVALVL